MALFVGSILSLGLGVAALLGLGATALLWHTRRARLTRRATWMGAVLAVCISCGGFGAWAVARAPGNFAEQLRQGMDQASREPPPPIVRRLQRFGPPPDPRVQKGVGSITRSTPFIWWTMVTALVMMSLFLGLLVGTPAWGCAMLIGYGVRGRWPMPPPEPVR